MSEKFNLDITIPLGSMGLDSRMGRRLVLSPLPSSTRRDSL